MPAFYKERFSLVAWAPFVLWIAHFGRRHALGSEYRFYEILGGSENFTLAELTVANKFNILNIFG